MRRTAREPSPWRVVAVAAPVFAMVMLDTTQVNVALPAIGRALDAEISDLQWIVSGLALVMVASLPIGGALGDRYGRRRMMLVGVAVFACASLAASRAPSVGWLVAARVPQGMGAGLMLPNALALVSLAFPATSRGKAIGAYTGIASSSLLVGPVLSGWLVEVVGWPAIFLVNVPLGLGAGLAVWWLLADDVPDGGRRLDVAGTVVASGTLLALTTALVESGRRGWGDPLVLGLLLAAATGAILLVRVERSASEPLLDPEVFRVAAVAAALLVALVNYIGLNSFFFLLPLQLQVVIGLGPAQVGFILLAFTSGFAVASPAFGRIADRVGSRWVLVGGALAMGACALALSRVDADTTVGPAYLGWLLLGGIGTGALNAAEATAVLTNAPARVASVASAALSITRQSGGIFGVALLGSVAELSYRSRVLAALDRLAVDDGLRQQVLALGLTDDAAALSEVAGGAEVLEVVGASLAGGIGLVMRLVTVATVIAALVAWWFVRPPRSRAAGGAATVDPVPPNA